MDLENAKASVYAVSSGTYYIKISIHDIGMYISGISVRKSPKFGGWWVQMPYFKDYKTGNTKRYIEFSPESSAKTILERLSIEAVENNTDNDKPTNSYEDNLPSEEDLDKPPDFSAIPSD